MKSLFFLFLSFAVFIRCSSFALCRATLKSCSYVEEPLWFRSVDALRYRIQPKCLFSIIVSVVVVVVNSRIYYHSITDIFITSTRLIVVIIVVDATVPFPFTSFHLHRRGRRFSFHQNRMQAVSTKQM